MDVISGEEVVNEKWKTFEEEYAKKNQQKMIANPGRSRGTRQPRKQVPKRIVEAKRQALRTVRKEKFENTENEENIIEKKIGKLDEKIAKIEEKIVQIQKGELKAEKNRRKFRKINI